MPNNQIILYNGTEIRPFNCNNYSKYREEYENQEFRIKVASNSKYKHSGPVYFLSYTAILFLMYGHDNNDRPSEEEVKGITFYHGKELTNLILLATPGGERGSSNYPTNPELIYKSGKDDSTSLDKAENWVKEFDRNSQANLKEKTLSYSFSEKQLRDLLYMDGGSSSKKFKFEVVIAPVSEDVETPKFFSLASKTMNQCQLSSNCPDDCYDPQNLTAARKFISQNPAL